EALQLEIELRLAGAVGFVFTELDRLLLSIFLFFKARVEEDVVRKFGERECARREFKARTYATIGCGRSVKICQGNRGFHLFWLDPAAQHILRKPSLDFHPVRQKFLHVCRGRTE